MHWGRLVLGALIAWSPQLAYAYLDPGTGSMIIQMLIAGVLAGMLYVKLAWANTKAFFSRVMSGRGGGRNPSPTRDSDSNDDV